MHRNLITRLGWEFRVAESQATGDAKNGIAGNPRIAAAAGELADYLLFADEAPLPGRVEGGCGFAEAFAARGPRDARGRSLREFDLERRVFKYPVSYMVYAPAFDALPAAAKSLVYGRIVDALSAVRRDPPSTGYSDAERQAALEILRATRP